MKSFVASIALFAAAANATVLGRAVCNADGCARAVTGTAVKPALTLRISDCSSFQRTTVTPATSTITVQAASVVTEYSSTTSTTYAATVTSYVVYTAPSAFKRDASNQPGLHPWNPTVTQAPRALQERLVAAAPTVPAYAASCSGPVRYASACSCYGITSTVTTLPTPLSTTTTTSTTTSTVSVSETQPTAVVNVEVCNPADDYGYKYNSAGLDGDYNIELPSIDRAACCAACYDPVAGICAAFASISDTYCQVARVITGTLPATGVCPNGVVHVFPLNDNPVVAIGPCGVVAAS